MRFLETLYIVFETLVTVTLVRPWVVNFTGSSSFTAKYNCYKLVYHNSFSTIEEAISEEKRIKAGSRQKKIDLINNINPEWKDLYDSLE